MRVSTPNGDSKLTSPKEEEFQRLRVNGKIVNVECLVKQKLVLSAPLSINNRHQVERFSRIPINLANHYEHRRDAIKFSWFVANKEILKGLNLHSLTRDRFKPSVNGTKPHHLLWLGANLNQSIISRDDTLGMKFTEIQNYQGVSMPLIKIPFSETNIFYLLFL